MGSSPHVPFWKRPSGPLIVSTTLEDAALSETNFDLDEARLKTILCRALWCASGPDARDAGLRRHAILQAERKAALKKAPVYMYLWAFASPGFGGKFGAVHGTDVSASFNNYQDGIGGAGSPDQKAVWHSFASAWVAFAKSGSPNNSATPEWPPYDARQRATMIFGREVYVQNDPRAEIRQFWAHID